MSESKPWRVGVVPYANALPLSWYLPQTLPDAQIIPMVPAQLGQALEQGVVDVAMLSSIELWRHPDYHAIPGLGICSDGPVRSVCVFSHQPYYAWWRAALDPHSLTSNLLFQILIKHYWRIAPELTAASGSVFDTLRNADAVLSIGDASLQQNLEALHRYDLGEIWKSWQKLPFVFALWIARKEVDVEALKAPFHQAKDMAKDNLPAIAQYAAQQNQRSREFYLDYYSYFIKYEIGEREQRGLNTFFAHAGEFIPNDSPSSFRIK